jgi:hypothetical protein
VDDPTRYYRARQAVWALYSRTVLLWASCLRMRYEAFKRFAHGELTREEQDDRISAFAVKAWPETSIIETALNRHTCDIESKFLNLGREWIFR